MEQKKPTIFRAYITLCLSKSGTLQKNQILTSLKSAGLPAHEDNAVAMMHYQNADTEGSISYSHFLNFMLLLPSERLGDDPWLHRIFLTETWNLGRFIMVGALSGRLAAVIPLRRVGQFRFKWWPFSILGKEGPIGLFKGDVPSFFWIAPLGAMNFAGYELAKKTMDKNEYIAGEQLHEKLMAGSG